MIDVLKLQTSETQSRFGPFIEGDRASQSLPLIVRRRAVSLFRAFFNLNIQYFVSPRASLVHMRHNSACQEPSNVLDSTDWHRY